MYLIGIFIFLAFLGISANMSGEFAAYMDIPSLIIISTFSISLLMASGLLSDFLRGFKIMGQKENTYSLIELRKTEEAINLMIRLLLLSGFLGSILGVIAFLVVFNDISKIAPNVAVALLTLFYSVLFVLMLLPIKSRVRAIILTID